MIDNTLTEQTYNCNGVTTNFPIPFDFLEGEEAVIKVYKILVSTGVATLQILDTDYTLDTPAVNVIMNVAPSNLYKIKVKRESSYTQDSTFVPGPFPAESVQEQFDRCVMLAQELKNSLAKMFTVSEGNPLADFTMPLASANKLLGWNAAATALENKDPLDIATMQTQIADLIEAVDELETDVAALQDLTSEQASSILTLQGSTANIGNDLDTLEAVVTAMGATLANVQPQIDDLQAQINAFVDVSAQVTDHETRIDSLETWKPTVDNTLNEFGTRLNQLEAASPISEFAGSITLLNNQAVPVPIIDPVTPANDFKRNAAGTQLARVMCQIDRRTDDEIRYTHVSLLMRYIEETELWYITRENTTAFVGEPDGVTFSIVTDPLTKVGQVYYESDNMPGANHAGKIKFLGKEIPTGV